MTKIRVHELAKELNKDNKDVLNFLKENNIEVKSHMSTLEDDAVDKVRKHFQKSGEKTEDAPKEEPKKKKLIHVFNPQNIQNANAKRNIRQNTARRKANAQNQAARAAQNAKSAPGKSEARPQTAQARSQADQAKTQAAQADQVRTQAAQTRAQAEQPGTQAGQPKMQAEQSKLQAAQAKVQAEQPKTQTAQSGAQAEQAKMAKLEAPMAQEAKEEAQAKTKEQPNTQPEMKAQNAAGTSQNAAPKADRGERQARGERNDRGNDRSDRRDNRSGDGRNDRRDNRFGDGRNDRRDDRRDNRNDDRRDNRSGDRRDNRGDRNDRGGRYNNEGRQGGRSFGGDRRDNRFGDGRNDRRDDRRDNRDDRRDNRGDRRDNRGGRNDRRDDRRDNRGGMPSIPAPNVAQDQKPSRKSSKNDYKKKDYRDEDRIERKGKQNKKQNAPKVQMPKKPEKVEEVIKMITIPEKITIGELAEKMKLQASTIIKKLFMQGKMVTVNQEVDYDTAEEIAMEFDVLVEQEEVVDVIEELLKEDEEDESKMKKRPPVICVMGHVDHGKTSLLDAIRHTNVISGEAGGITQHIGASVVKINGEKITFLDTPGHEAFTSMRLRGAQSTDIAILVVAADDGVMPQTVEAINHAKAAGIEIIVAVNKIDKPGANIDRVKQELTEYELIAEDWGGSTVFVPVSAKTGEGIDELLEMIILTAEVLELKANPNRRARGLVIEAQLDKGRGPVATVLIQKGTLRIGDTVAAGAAHGKVRAMVDDKGRRVKEAGPSTPVEILGLNDVPNAGEVFVGCKNEKDARSFAETFISQGRMKMLEETKQKMSLDDLFNQIQAGNLKELNIIVKADVQGSVEAIKQSLLKLSNDEVVVKIIHGAVGAINESDVTLASASNAIIIGFNVRPDATAKDSAEREGVDVRLYRVIYNAIEDVEAAMKGMLDPVFEEKVLGHAEVRQTFHASGVGTIAGAYVLDGTVERDCQARIVRDGIVIYDGKLASLKRFKDDVKEVRAGFECGFVFEKFNDIKEGDQVESFKMVEIPR